MMSSIPNLEPHAFGHIIFKTTFGDIDIELFTKQCAKACKLFLQLCLSGYYNGTTFDRVEKDFIAVCGNQGPKIGCFKFETYTDEFHARLRFTRRGLLASANSKKDDNGGPIFFTLGPAPELQNKHTIFGRVRGTSIYHLVDLNECQVDESSRPYSEKKVISVIVVNNPLASVEILTPSETSKVQKKSKIRSELDPDDNRGEGDFPETSKKVKLETKNTKTETETALTAKEKRLREIRAQIQSLRDQIENGVQVETLSEKQQHEGRSSRDSSRSSLKVNESSSSQSDEIGTTGSRANKREQETKKLVTDFKKTLKEKSLESHSDHLKRKNGHKLDTRNASDYFDEDLDELASLDKLDSDEWMTHRFNAK